MLPLFPVSSQEGLMVDTTVITMMRVTALLHLTMKGEGWALLLVATAGAPAAMALSTDILLPLLYPRSTALMLTALC